MFDVSRPACAAMFGAAATFAAGQTTGPAAPTTAPEAAKPNLRQVSPELNLGAHKPLAFISDTITLLNEGDRPITLAKAVGECSCTDATILGDKGPVPPGGQVDVLVAVEFPRQMGEYRKNLLVYEEGNPNPYAFPIDFEVGYPVRINGGPGYSIVIKRVGNLKFKSDEGRPFTIRSIHGAAPIFLGFDAAKDSIRDEYEVIYDWSHVAIEDLPRWLVIETDHPEAEMMVIPARIPGWTPIHDQRGWHALDEFIAMGAIPPDVTSRVTMVFTGKPLIPGAKINLTSSNPNVLMNVAAARKPDRGGGMELDLNVRPATGFTGFASTIVTVEYDGARTAFDVFVRVDPEAKPRARSN